MNHATVPLRIALLFSCVSWTACQAEGNEPVSLAGQWAFSLDRADAGVNEKWFARRLPDHINLPGSLQEQGFGNAVNVDTHWAADSGVRRTKYPDWFSHPMYERYRRPDSFRFPYWLQPNKHYIGPAWYQREVEIPPAWKDRHIRLTLERCHWASRLWVDDHEAGSRNSLATPHVYDLSQQLSSGRHRLTLRVDNSMIAKVGINAHSVSDQTQTAWNGVVGRIELSATSPVWIEDVQVFPNVAKKSIQVKGTLGNVTGKAGEGAVKLQVEPRHDGSHHRDQSVLPTPVRKAMEFSVSWTGDGGSFDVEYALGDDAPLWDEFMPALHRLTVSLQSAAGRDVRELSFGLREFSAKGTEFIVNGRPVFLRGTLECCIFPLTGYPPTDVASWRRIMTTCKDYGLNHLRFHSWCPPEAAFVAADERGVYLQPECDLWAPVKTPALAGFLRDESERMLRTYGNHPSFVMMSLGNESPVQKPIMKTLLAQWKTDPRRVYTGPCNAPTSIVPEYDYCVAGKVADQRLRYQHGWPPAPKNVWFVTLPPQTNIDFSKAVAMYDKPLVSHELVQRCAYPDLNQQGKYTGFLRAAYLDIARDQLEANGLLDQAKDFVRASGRWQLQFFKEEIEAALRTPGFGGFQLLDLHDFPGQGAALVGVLDAFWDSKGYVTPVEFRRFCGPTVPLARFDRRTFTSDSRLKVTIEVAHFGPTGLSGARPRWRILGARGETIAEQSLAMIDIPVGGPIRLGTIDLALSDWPAPAKYKLVVELPDASAVNDWDFWVFPSTVDAQAGDVVITHDPVVAQDRLKAGAKVLLLAQRDTIAGDIPQCFTPIYWNAPYTDGGESQTLGLLCNPASPVFREFPTDFHSNWHWYDLLVTARPMILTTWPKPHRPLVQLIDDWYQNRVLGVLTEARLGTGRLMLCSMDLETNLATRPAARQFRASLLHYMNSSAFDPSVTVTAEQVQSVFKSNEAQLNREK